MQYQKNQCNSLEDSNDQKATQKEINNLNILTSTKETELVFKILLTKKTPDPNTFTSEFYQLIFSKDTKGNSMEQE